MLAQTRDEDLSVFLSLVKEKPKSRKDLSIFVVIPAFVLSELKVGFEIGFILYIPFLVVDMIVASILMSMGMMMLPPIMISLPFKILLFVLIDGWRLVTEALLKSFH
jgi:flagellar biosynthetic protein FliP